MRKLSLVVLVCFFACLFAVQASARDALVDLLVKKGVITEDDVKSLEKELKKEAEYKTQVSGRAYLRYSYEFKDPAKSANEFEIDRLYTFFKKRTSSRTKFDVSFDVAPRGDTLGAGLTAFAGTPVATETFKTQKNTGYAVFLKSGYFTLERVIPQADLEIGQIGIPWVSFEEGYWKYRAIQKVLADQNGVITSTDLGIGLRGKIPDLGDYHITLTNGEGWKAPEMDNTKSVMTRVTVKPFRDTVVKDVALTGYFDKGHSGAGLKKDRASAAIACKECNPSFGFTYLTAKDAAIKKKGISLYGNYDFTETKYSFLARYDKWDPDTAVQNDATKRITYGLAYKLNDKTKFIINNQITNRDAAGAADSSIFNINLESNF